MPVKCLSASEAISPMTVLVKSLQGQLPLTSNRDIARTSAITERDSILRWHTPLASLTEPRSMTMQDQATTTAATNIRVVGRCR